MIQLMHRKKSLPPIARFRSSTSSISEAIEVATLLQGLAVVTLVSIITQVARSSHTFTFVTVLIAWSLTHRFYISSLMQQLTLYDYRVSVELLSFKASAFAPRSLTGKRAREIDDEDEHDRIPKRSCSTEGETSLSGQGKRKLIEDPNDPAIGSYSKKFKSGLSQQAEVPCTLSLDKPIRLTRAEKVKRTRLERYIDLWIPRRSPFYTFPRVYKQYVSAERWRGLRDCYRPDPTSKQIQGLENYLSTLRGINPWYRYEDEEYKSLVGPLSGPRLMFEHFSPAFEFCNPFEDKGEKPVLTLITGLRRMFEHFSPVFEVDNPFEDKK